MMLGHRWLQKSYNIWRGRLLRRLYRDSFRFGEVRIWFLKTVVEVPKIVILALREIVEVITAASFSRFLPRQC